MTIVRHRDVCRWSEAPLRLLIDSNAWAFGVVIESDRIRGYHAVRLLLWRWHWILRLRAA
jgi:hypothetical protein